MVDSVNNNGGGNTGGVNGGGGGNGNDKISQDATAFNKAAESGDKAGEASAAKQFNADFSAANGGKVANSQDLANAGIKDTAEFQKASGITSDANAKETPTSGADKKDPASSTGGASKGEAQDPEQELIDALMKGPPPLSKEEATKKAKELTDKAGGDPAKALQDFQSQQGGANGGQQGANGAASPNAASASVSSTQGA